MGLMWTGTKISWQTAKLSWFGEAILIHSAICSRFQRKSAGNPLGCSQKICLDGSKSGIFSEWIVDRVFYSLNRTIAP